MYCRFGNVISQQAVFACAYFMYRRPILCTLYGAVDFLKVPKHENFSIAFFALSEPIWVCDVGTAKKIEFFYRLSPDFDVFGFFAAY